MSEIKVDTLTGKTSAGSITVTSEGGSATMQMQQGLAKAWVNFNGTGTISIRDSLNAAGLVDNGTGDYTVNYSNSLSDSNNSPVTGAGGSGYTDRLLTLDTVSASSVKVVENSTDTTQDVLICTVHSMGDLA
jgi:hypothetical protein